MIAAQNYNHNTRKLLNLKKEILNCINMPRKNQPSKKIRNGLRDIIRKHFNCNHFYFSNNAVYIEKLMTKYRFNLAGTLAWNKLVTMAFAIEPLKMLTDLEAAFNAVEHGLNAEQEIEALDLIEKINNVDRENQLEIERLAKAMQEEERAAKAKKDADTIEFDNNAKSLLSNPDVSADQFDGLEKSYNYFHDDKLTLLRAVKRYDLSSDTKKIIEDRIESKKFEIAKQKEIEQEAARIRQKWEKSLLYSTDVQTHLSISATEYQRWLTEEKLVPSLKREFRKWGKWLEMPLFDPVYLDSIKQMIPNWREEHAEVTSANRKASSVKAAETAKKTKAIKKIIALENFENEFVLSRSLDRHFHLCLGPTNSGKTHHAIEALSQAKTGVYLAPLRLLALENFERLKAAGVAVSLITGEERIIEPNATHISATVEMCDFEIEVDVAVIDEVQMMGDSQRGWAWISAILGVPAKSVFVCGAAYAESAVKDLLAITNESYTQHTFERLTKLDVDLNAIQLHEVGQGDAVIAFSRQEVLNFAAMLKKRNLKVSIIYGALSPEVRKLQANAFINGDTNVVVSTDAIGMGLNLPIKRIIFSNAKKYDGVNYRDLYPQEIQQIAGRAGRFGLHDRGIVSAFSKNDTHSIAWKNNAKVEDITSPFIVMPTWMHIVTIMEHEKTDCVLAAVKRFQLIKFKGTFKQADLKETIGRLQVVIRFNLNPKDTFALGNAPADIAKNEDYEMLVEFGRVLSGRVSQLSVPECDLDLLHKAQNSRNLPIAEAYSRKLALFSWFACKFPGLALSDGLSEKREMLAIYIDKCLLSHNEVFTKNCQKHYKWRDYDDDDDNNNDNKYNVYQRHH